MNLDAAVNFESLFRFGRCGDRGFHESFQDGSDQVRHFCWALRLFANADSPEKAARLLQLKELRDSFTRSVPVNEADRLLNQVAGELIEHLRAETAFDDALTWEVLFRQALTEVQFLIEDS